MDRLAGPIRVLVDRDEPERPRLVALLVVFVRVEHRCANQSKALADFPDPRVVVAPHADHVVVALTFTAIPKFGAQQQTVALESFVDVALVPAPEHVVGKAGDAKSESVI